MNVLDETELIAYALRELYMQAGYRRYRMSKFEEYDLYSRNKSFLGTDEIVTFTDTNGKLMALKPDVTLSIIRNTPDGEGACATTRTCTAPRRAARSKRSCRRAWNASAAWTPPA